MGRRKKRPPPEAQGPYIIESPPSLRAPQPNGQELAEAAHWYYARDGWVSSKRKAHQFESASAAVSEISELRRKIAGVEFTLVPIQGGVMYRPF
jgi:hypothetical protein